MKIFLSWSGDTSRSLAMLLKTWLPDVLQHIDVWMSEHDLDAGSKWGQELTNILGDTHFGIICLTPENQEAPWLLFEAGCLAKTGQIARVVPYLYGLTPTDVRYPLAQFQGVGATKSGTAKLLQSINEAGQLGIAADRLERLIEKWWPDLEKALELITTAPQARVAKRSEREMLEELLGLLRNSAGAYRYESNIAQSAIVTIDVSKFFEKRGNIFIEYDPFDTVSNFLDTIYFELNKIGKVAAYEYGNVWVLQDQPTGKQYDDLGIEYCRTHGRVEDNRAIVSVGIAAGDKLEVVRGSGPQGNRTPLPKTQIRRRG